MPAGGSSRRYAQAVFQLALEHDGLEMWLDDLTLLASATQDAEFSAFLDAPQVTVAQKIQVIADSLGDHINPLALNLVSLLAGRNSAGLITGITEVYQELLDAHTGIERADVVTAVGIDDDQQKRIADLLKSIVGKEVTITTRVEPELIGGFVARVGDRVIDGSTRTRLAEMKRGI
ncbi:MAG: F0F1 ATP synthase subunit delta, partial [Chloroflexi bacterium]|nr:F0F1 ATP synthase subunit delta [Chloroflexota bacterium]